MKRGDNRENREYGEDRDDKKNNRGQVTIFIIMGILIVAAVAVFFIFRGNINTDKSSSQVSPIYTKTLSCLDSTTQEGIKYIALQGGYYVIPQEVLASYNVEKSSYYYINSRTNIPSLERVSRELEKYVVDNLKYCVDFKNLEEQGFAVEEGNLTVIVEINGDEVDVKANYPLTVKKGEDTSIFGEFKVIIPSGVNRVYSACEEIVNLYYKNPGYVCISCLDKISGKYNVETKATSIEEKSAIWFSVIDSESDLKWRFVVEQ